MLNFRKLNREWIVPALMLLGMLIFGVVFYYDYTRTADLGDREVVGFITYKYNRVQRQLDGQVVWSNLTNNSPLANRDTIRSDDYAEAKIHLNDGTVINIDERSMFFLDLTDDSISIDFRSGAIQVEQGEGARGIRIQQGDNVIEARDSDLALQSDGEESGLNVVVQRGEASVSSGGRQQRVGADERASMGAEGIAVEQIRLQLQGPDNLTVEPSGAEGKPMQFQWNLKAPMRALRFEISRDRNFSSVFISRPAGPNGTSQELPPGSWYWRLRGTNAETGETETSEVRKVAIVRNEPLDIYAPRGGEIFTFVNELPPVQFSWSQHPFAAAYQLEIASDRGFNQMVQERRVSSNGLAVSSLQPGQYFWRVRTVPTLDSVPPQTSSAGSFSVAQQSSHPEPRPDRPTEATPISADTFKEEGVLFSWQGSREMQSYTLEVSPDPYFASPIVSQETRSNYAVVKGVENPGEYYWRVRGRDRQGNVTEASPAARFRVSDRPQKELGDVATAADRDVLDARAEEEREAERLAEERRKSLEDDARRKQREEDDRRRKELAEKERAERETRERAEREKAEREKAERDKDLQDIQPGDIEFTSPETIYK